MCDVSEKTLNLASRFLSYRMRTRAELDRHLKEKGVDPSERAACIARMEEYHLLDDLEYARMYIESMLERGRGLARIRRELAGKGVDRYVIEDAVALLGDDLPDEYEAALGQALEELAEENLLAMDYREKQKAKARIVGRLTRRGYEMSTVLEALQAAFSRREQELREERD